MHRHGHRRRMPAARGEPPEMGLGGGLVGQMERLRVVFARELEHFLAGHFIGAEFGLRRRPPDLRNRSSPGAYRAPAAWRERKERATMARGNPGTASGRWHPRLDRGGDGDQRKPARRRRAPAQAASQGRSVRRRAIRMLAELAARIGRWRDAEKLLRRAIEIAPGFTAARANLALVLGRTGPAGRSARAARRHFRRRARGPRPLEPQGGDARPARRFRRGDRLYEQVLEQRPNQPRVWLSYGHMLKTVGRQAEGIAAYRKAIALNPTLGEAWWSLANLKTVKFDEADVAAMEQALHATGADRRGPVPSRFRAGQGDARCRPRATRRSLIIRRATRCG